MLTDVVRGASHDGFGKDVELVFLVLDLHGIGGYNLPLLVRLDHGPSLQPDFLAGGGLDTNVVGDLDLLDGGHWTVPSFGVRLDYIDLG